MNLLFVRRRSSSPLRVRLAPLALALLLAPIPPALARAQTPRAASGQGNVTRAELQALAETAERTAGNDAKKRAVAAALRTRLRDGDFSAGDRVVLEVRGDSAAFDTLMVRTGPVLPLAGYPAVSLQGVLRSELQDHLTRYLSRYIRQPEVRAESLIRLSLLGQVGKPGYYDFSSDMLLTDAIMTAGGPTGTAALDRSTIRRGKSVILARGAVATAAQRGATLDRLGVRPGDEVEIGAKKAKFNWGTVGAIAGVVTSIGWTLAYLLN